MEAEYLIKLKNLLAKIPSSLPHLEVVTMPDFFLDHFLYYPMSLEDFKKEITAIYNRGGGEIAGYPQRIAAGGNAVNTAIALASLGAVVKPIVRTNPLGLQILEQLAPPGVDLSMVHVDGDLSLALNIEIEGANIMFGDPKNLDFNFGNFSEKELEVLRKADYVCVFNWTYNNSGTELASEVFKYVKDYGVGKTFLDISDPAPKLSGLGQLVEKVLIPNLVDVLGLNENEAYLLLSQIDPKIVEESIAQKSRNCYMVMAEKISQHINSRIDLHTTEFSFSFKDGELLAVAPSFKVVPLRVTGAGDVWTAANIVGESIGLNDEYRLLMANAAAAIYISEPNVKYPNLNEIRMFIEKYLSSE